MYTMWKLAAKYIYIISDLCVTPLKTANNPDGGLALIFSLLTDLVLTHY